MNLIQRNEVTFKVTEYINRFLISGHFKGPLDLRASHNLVKIEPTLVSQQQLKESSFYESSKSIIVNKINSKLVDIAIAINNRNG